MLLVDSPSPEDQLVRSVHMVVVTIAVSAVMHLALLLWIATTLVRMTRQRDGTNSDTVPNTDEEQPPTPSSTISSITPYLPPIPSSQSSSHSGAYATKSQLPTHLLSRRRASIPPSYSLYDLPIPPAQETRDITSHVPEQESVIRSRLVVTSQGTPPGFGRNDRQSKAALRSS